MTQRQRAPLTEALEHIVSGNYSQENARFDEADYEGNFQVPFLVVFSFLRRYMRREYHMVNRDPEMAMVVAEIWLYNVSRTLAKEGGQDSRQWSDSTRLERFAKCNTYSVAQYLGIPPQTVRRKVQALIDMGWVEKDARGQLIVTKAAEDKFNPDFNHETMRDFISTARTLFATLGLELSPTPNQAATVSRSSKPSP